MSSHSIRQNFLEYFKNKGHTVVLSSPVIPANDPTLLFINAGMNQFKDVFLGKNIREYTTATSSQKCIRVGGKHNDLENVGHTTRHLTFFEMLGNFSFGDYFKSQAIAYAWDLTLNVFEFDPEKLWATVYHEDEESFELWKSFLPQERIIRMGEKDNFWAMGDTGPCGPCSELYFDRGIKYAPARSPAEDISGERFLEFWNLVFMEYNRNSQGELHPLPKQSVDTGSGLERVLSLKMGVDSLFETDILRELIAQVENICGKSYEANKPHAASFRVIADHTRSLAFAMSDGVQPSNIERGYVLRKIVRRAVRYGRQLGLDHPFLALVIPRLVQMMGRDFPELESAQDRICEILTQEEEGFLRTLKRGGNILSHVISDSKKRGQISGENAFKLKDTYGLPLEEIVLLAKDDHLNVDIRGFEELEHEAKERSRKARKPNEQIFESKSYETFFEQQGPTTFLGYQQSVSEAIILSLMKDGVEVSILYEGETGIIVLDQTPFYAEKGGQIADQGTITCAANRFEVMDCQSFPNGVLAHSGLVRQGEIHVGERVIATIDSSRRKHISNNHTATHLLHWALREILGPHIKQAGSIVEPSRLRFDFSHHKALTQKEITQIEDLVNTKIRDNEHVHVYELDLGEAQTRKDIVQFFGEKYSSKVRVIDINFSKELCGGTHTQATGTIGYFRINKESSIAAGMRRIEAVTGPQAEELSRQEKDELTCLLENKQKDSKALSLEIARLKREVLTIEVENLIEHRILVGPFPFLAHTAFLDIEELKECAELIIKKESSLVLFLIGKQENRCSLLVRVTADLIHKGIKAVDLLQAVAPLIGGKGGGKADAAQGGGNQLENIPKALEYARTWLEQKIS